MVEKSHTAGTWPDLYGPLREMGHKIADWIAPRSDASASPEYYEINLELPGVSMDDVDVSVQDNSLVVKGEKRFEREEEGRDFFFSEREYGAFHRTFRLPPDADTKGIDGSCSQGVLHLKIPKRQDSQPEGQRVKIRTR